MLALTATTGKIGGAVLNFILKYNLVSPAELVICTSSDPEDVRWDGLRKQGAVVRRSNYDDPASMVKAFAGCKKLFLVSTPRIEMDFNDAPPGHGRERHHFAAINAAVEAGVQHIYYTSLAFGYGHEDSVAGVMRAHLRTESYLAGLKNLKYTIIREGLYNESWPLYLGYYFDLNKDERKEVVVAGDGRISWTSIADLGLATALVLADPSTEYDQKVLYLSTPTKMARTLKEIAATVSEVRGRKIELKNISRDEFVRYYSEERGRDKASVEWWVSSYSALERGECLIEDGSLSKLLASKGVKPKPVEETIREMLAS